MGNIHQVDSADRLTLLIIDDSPEWTDLLSTFFSEKYDVRVSNSSAHAVQMVLTQPPSVMIVDLVMPSLDGFGVIRRLKDSLAANVPTVLLTGWDNPDIRECGESIGCAAVLSKSVSLGELDDAVSSALRRAA
jgi:two-component system, OmpR family, response regulator